MLFDEDHSGAISIHEYYYALHVYKIRTDDILPFDSSEALEHKVVNKFVDILISREFTDEDFFRMMDYNGDTTVNIKELQTCIKSLTNDFSIKEMHSIY